MLKTTGLSEVLAPKIFRANDNEVVGSIGSQKANEMVKNLSKSKKSKNTKSEILTHINIKAIGEFIFLTPGTREDFNHLQ